MTIVQKLTLLLFGLTLLSCGQTKTTKEKKAHIDTIAKLLDSGLTTDTLEYHNEQPFLFFKSGHILSKTEKNAVTVSSSKYTTYLVKLYYIKNNKWEIADSISGLEAFPSQFEITFKDFNFDNHSDIYIQVSASNGWSLSRGHLLIVNPITKKLIIHVEARDLANMEPNSKTNTVFSELWQGYNSKGRSQLTIFTNKWIHGKLKTVSKKDTIFK